MDTTRKRLTLFNFFDSLPSFKQPFRAFESSLLAAKRRKNQLRFLKDCLAEQVLPLSLSHFLRFNTSGSPFPEHARLLLQELIHATSLQVDEAFLAVRQHQRFLSSSLPSDLCNIIFPIAFDTADLSSSHHSSTLHNKLQRLISHSPWAKYSLSDCVTNLSSSPLSKHQQELLGLGLSFATSPGPRCGIDLISSFDRFVNSNSSTPSDLSAFRGALIPVLDSLFSKNHHLPRRFQLALASLKSNNSILILPSDKGNSVVVLDREDYLQKADVLLSDSRTYAPLTSNPLDRLKTSFNRKLRQLSSLCPPDFDLIKRFRVICPSLPYFYGLPKTHKPGVPLRPIISSRGSVSYFLASWLAKTLTPYLGTFSPAHLRHSQDFIERLRLQPSCKMLSLDVDSLFTNVPLEDVLSFLRRKATEGLLPLPLPTDIFLDLIRLCVDSNSFSFNGRYYTQTFGVAMGSPLSPVLANLYMEYFETVLLPTIDTRPSLWLRYVDDIFALWPHDLSLFQPFLSSLNNLAPSINFKVEWESNSLLPFLDVHVHSSVSGFSFSVYRKPMHSGMYIHFFSYHPPSVKKSVLVSLFLRALRISDPQFLDSEIAFIYKSFSRLGYPLHFINCACSQAKRNFFHPKPSSNTSSTVLCLPFISELKTFTNTFRPLDIKLAFRQTNTLRSNLVHTAPPSSNAAGVYSISCSSCPLQYFGETGRTLNDRLKEHKRSVKSADTNNALFCHVRDSNHPIDWSSSKIIFPASTLHRRRLVESALIHNLPNMNLSPGFVAVDSSLSQYILKCSNLSNKRDLT